MQHDFYLSLIHCTVFPELMAINLLPIHIVLKYQSYLSFGLHKGRRASIRDISSLLKSYLFVYQLVLLSLVFAALLAAWCTRTSPWLRSSPTNRATAPSSRSRARLSCDRHWIWSSLWCQLAGKLFLVGFLFRGHSSSRLTETSGAIL